MRTRWFVVALATLVAIFVYAAHCRAAADSESATYGYVPLSPRVQTPRGTLGASSYGLALLDVGTPDPVLALHVRAIVTNTSALPWSLDLQSAGVTLPEDYTTGAFAINADAETMPTIVVEPGQHRVIELYFPMPAAVYDVEDVPTFELTWLHRRIDFARVALDKAPVIDPDAGCQRHWWFASTYPWPSFRHVDGTITPMPPTSATVAWLHADRAALDEEP